MNWLVLSWFLTQNQQAILDDGWASVFDRPCLEQNIGLTLTAWDHVRLATNIKTYDNNEKQTIQFMPFRTDYVISLEYISKNITIGMRHECDHPVLYGLYHNDKDKYFKNETELYVTFHGSMSF